jgi:predicted O-methyltransferase YrrM
MLIDEVKKKVESKLNSQIMASKILLDKLRLIDEDSRKSSQYQDPNYLPFYYYLARSIEPKSILHIGLDLALPSCCFLQGSSSVDRILCFQRESKEFYSPRLAISNIKDIKGRNFNIDYYRGKASDLEFANKMSKGFDIVLITEKVNSDQINETLDICWDYLNLDGFIVVDYVLSNRSIGDMFSSFCKSKNKPYFKFKTRYGTGITQK